MYILLHRFEMCLSLDMFEYFTSGAYNNNNNNKQFIADKCPYTCKKNIYIYIIQSKKKRRES